MSKAKLVVLRCLDGGFAGWAGMDVETNPGRPLLFSHFLYPEYRGLGLGALLEHVWWAYLSAWGCKIGYQHLESGSSKRLLKHKRTIEYCRQLMKQENVARQVEACHICELYDGGCKDQAYLAIDVEKALAASIRQRGPLDICGLPMSFWIDVPSPLLCASPASHSQH